MSFLSFNLDPYGQSFMAFFLLAIPAGFYILGIYEDRKGDWFFATGILIHLLSILQRWGYTGLIPLSEKRDNISLTAFIMALVYFYLRRRARAKDLSVYVMPLICAAMFVAIGHRTVDSISPFMHTPWFYMHILFYFASYAFFGISSSYALQYLVTGQSAQETLAYRLASDGWIILSASLLFGSVWFYLAYGTYFLWTSREMWITIMWLYYGLYLHARMIKRLRGKAAAAIGLAGFAIALFTYFGIGTLIKSPPTQF